MFLYREFSFNNPEVRVPIGWQDRVRKEKQKQRYIGLRLARRN